MPAQLKPIMLATHDLEAKQYYRMLKSKGWYRTSFYDNVLEHQAVANEHRCDLSAGDLVFVAKVLGDVACVVRGDEIGYVIFSKKEWPYTFHKVDLSKEAKKAP